MRPLGSYEKGGDGGDGSKVGSMSGEMPRPRLETGAVKSSQVVLLQANFLCLFGGEIVLLSCLLACIAPVFSRYDSNDVGVVSLSFVWSHNLSN